MLAASLGANDTIFAQTSQFGIYPVGSWPGYLRGPSSLLSLKGNYAYVVLSVGPGQFQVALVVLDISDPNAPKRLGCVGIKDGVMTMSLVASYAYLFTSSSELVIVDIGNPVNPIVVRTISFGSFGFGSGFTSNGRYGYLVGGNFRVLDLQDPASPVLVADLDVAFEARDISVSGNLACIALVNKRSLTISGMIVMDVQTPANPQQLSGYTANGWCVGVRIDGQRAFLAHYDGNVEILDLSNPSAPVRVGGYAGGAGDFVVKNNLAYSAFGSEGVKIFDVSNVSNVVQISSIRTRGSASQMVLSNEYAYVTDGKGLLTAEIRDVSSPKEIGYYETDGAAYAVSVAGNYAYLSEAGGVQIIDITNPSEPRRNAQWMGLGKVVVENNYAFVTDSSGIVVFEVHDPANPSRVGNLTTLAPASALAVAGDFVYVAEYPSTLGVGGFEIVDVSNPATPTRVGALNQGRNLDVAVSGDFAYLAVGSSGMNVINVSSPANPVAVAGYTVPSGYSESLAVSSNHVYLAAGSGGLHIIDVTNPLMPSKVSEVTLPNGSRLDLAEYVDVVGKYAFVTDNYKKLYAIDVSNATNPIVQATYTNLFFYGRPKISGNFAYVAEGHAGLAILGLDPPGLATPATLVAEMLSGSTRLSVLGQPGRMHVIQAAIGLGPSASWQNIVTNSTPAGIFTSDLESSANIYTQFFRAVSY